MITKKFGNKKIIIRELESKDIENAKKFCDYINSLVKEDAKILINKKIEPRWEKDYIKNAVKRTEERTKVMLVAEHDNQIVGISTIEQDSWKRNHLGLFGISVRGEYRGIGLGGACSKRNDKTC